VYYLFFIVLFTSFYNPVTTLLDSINLDMIEQNPEVSYGELRLWASIGWATGTVVTGQFINSSNLHLIFAIAAVQLFLVACVTFFLYKPLRVTKNIASLKLNTIKDLIFSDRRLTIFLGVLLAYGVFSAPIQMFINIYYSEIGAGYNQIGYAFAVQSLSELPFFFFGQRIVNRYGAKNVLIFTMVVTALRMVAYGFTANPWVAIAIGSSHGIGLALFLVAVVNYLHAYVPAHLRATGQSFVFAFYFGAGVSGGNMFTGWLKDLISIKTAMWLQGSLALSLAVLAVFILTNKHHKEEAETTVEMA
jgi:oligosaccharide:H+ symporter